MPLDVPRDQVRTPQWMPLGVYDLRVGMQSDLVKVLQNVVQVVCGRARGPTPLLVDINIHYRLLKMLYGSSYAQWPLTRMLRPSPPLFGVWHAYKDCVLNVFRAFHPIFVFLRDGPVEVGSQHPLHPSL